MRRTDILQSIESLREALNSSGLTTALGLAVRRSAEPNTGALLPSLNLYSIAAARFDKATLDLVDILHLESLSDAKTWDKLLIPDGRPLVHELYQLVRLADAYLPKFAALLEQKGVEEYLESLPAAQQTKENVDTISVILLENEDQFSKPQRLIELLQAVNELYQGFAQMLAESGDGLTVLSCDSGSDKSFDFLGAAKVMEQIRELVIALWDRVVFFKEKRIEAQMDLIIKGLPVLAEVTEMQSTGKLGPEQAEIIRRFIEGGTTKFLNAGAIIPEIREHAYHEPRALMAPEKKLLMPPPLEGSRPPSDSGADSGDNEEETIEELRARLDQLERRQVGSSSNISPANRPAKARNRKPSH